MANLSNINNYFVVNTSGSVAVGDASSSVLPSLTVPFTVFKSGANSILSIQSGGGSGKPYFLRSNTNGSFSIYDDLACLERLTILSGGNVGIGAPSPSQKLHIADSSTSYALAETTGTGTSAGFRMKGSASADYTLFTTQGTNQFAIYDNAAGAERMRITSAGNVGIGTASPRSITNHTSLTVNGTAVGRVDLATSDTIYASFYAVSSQVGLQTEANIPLTFGTGTGSPERMRIDSSGRVGIGTTSPSGSLAAGGLDVVDRIAVGSGSVGTPALHYRDDTDTGIYFGTGIVATATAGVERMRITSAGNVGIGFSFPDGYANLAVSGTSSLPILGLRSSSGKARLAFYESGTGRFYLDTLNGSDGLAFIDGDGSTERMRITSGGALRLTNEIATASKTIDITNSAGTTGWTLGNGVIASAHQFVIYDNTAGSARMLINSSGNVGIGTTSPSRHLDIREQEQTYSGVLKLSSAWTGSNVWVERLFAASFIRQAQEVGVDLLSLGSIGGNSHVLIEVSILAVAATAQQSAKITFFAGARQASGGGYGSHYVTTPVLTAIQGSNISGGTPAWQGNTLIYTTFSQTNYTRYQVDFRVTCHDYMNITFEL